MRKIKPEKIEEEKSLESPKEYYPMFHIEVKYLPEAKKWKIGSTYYLTLEIKQTGISIRKDKINKEIGNVDFDIMGIEVVNRKKDYRELPDRE